MNNPSVLASCLYSAWRLGDQDLRDDLKHAIKAYVQRRPEFVRALRAAVASFTDPAHPSDRSVYELAASLSSVWHFGDAELRSDVEALIRRLAKRNPMIVHAFKRIEQSTDVQVIQAARTKRIDP